MKLEYFIAKRLITTKNYKSSISAPIIKIAIAAIAIGMIMMIVSIATGMGLQQKIRQKISAFNGHVIISNYDDNQSEVSVEPISLNQKFYPKFKSIDGISHIQAVATKAGIIRTEKAFEGIVFKGVGKDFQWENLQEYIISGTIPNLKTNLNPEVIISQYLANRLQLKVGDKFNTYFMKEEGKLPNLRNFKIVGTYNSGFQEFDATYILGDIRHVQRINKWQKDQVGAFEVFITDFSKIKEKGEEIYAEIPSTYNSVTIEEKYFNIFEWLKLFDFNIVVILIIMIVVATINMVVALLVLILERTQMIGILKAIGANNWTVRKIFLYNAGYLILRGLFWGNLVGISVLLVQKHFGVIKLNPENYYVTEAPVAIDVLNILVLNLGTILVCLLVLLIPSYIITKISPVKAIRFD
ncbi:ABC transporter, permease protein [Flavobacterium saliperosum S13]|uniref:Lipoprotein-releasing system permease protein n=2 Tax=Flavobacterium saliperosum TaxID=329186 RepID=A0A1G4VW51_9FLAO|nr:FtsX-like permease family protein [Flavobacterium saliperosum]ESU27244.1 ABC transporter, permease protein [Flavobacterium saliperosum S13]SCX12307.1 lipoprotein-releasing system permease protein [Flavobacterium saliperosum]